MKFRRTVGGLAALATASSAALMSFAAPASAGSVTSPGFSKDSDHSAVSLLKGSDGQVTGIEPEGSPLALPQKLLATLSSTTQIATAQLDRHLSPFGVKASDMEVTKSTEVGNGSVVRYQQYKDGVKVFGGQLVTSLDKSGALQSILGHTATGAFDQASDPIRELKGGFRAKKYVAKKSDTQLADLDVKTEGHRVYNPSVVGAPGPDANLDAYEYTVTDQSGAQHWTVLVNRQLGGVLLGFNQTSHALNRDVCDRNNQDGALDDAICDGSTNEYVRTEGSDPSGIADADEVYDNLGKVAQTYAAYTNLDVTEFIGNNVGGDGKALRATTRVCSTQMQPDCPMANAFWTAGENGQMVYGEGFTGLDVTGHELSHGVTEHTSGLYNVYQSGALNESNSDVWGE
ncbi:MAG: M4 family metallopeptidase, partial [Nocardioidaceae bacterium]